MAQSQEATRTILKNLDRASELIKSFKQVAVDRSSEEIRDFDVCEYIRETLASLKPNFKNKKHLVNFPCHDQIIMKTNPGAIAQVITNLVLNSLIHGFSEEEPGNILIQLHKEGTNLIMIYQDDGRGMDEETQKKIFDPFFTTKRGSGGSGLGMHILYNLITQTLQGTIGVQSSLGNGAVFTITIPLQVEVLPQKEE